MKKLMLIPVAVFATLALTALSYKPQDAVNAMAPGITGSTSPPITVTTTSASTFIPFGQVRLTCTSPTYYSVNASSSTAATTSSSLAPGPVVVNNVTITRSVWLTVSSGTQWLALLLKGGVQGTCIAEQVGTDGNTGSFTTLAASGATTLSSTLAVTGTSTLQGAVTTGGNVDAGTLNVAGQTTIAGALITSAAVTAGTTLTVSGDSITASTKTRGTCALNNASPSVCTATVNSGAICVCANNTTAANGVKCAVSSTTLTITGPNTTTDTVSYVCMQ